MLVRFKKTLLGDYGRARKGDVREVKADVGAKLVKLGYVVETKGPPKSGAIAKAARAAKAKKPSAEPSAQS